MPGPSSNVSEGGGKRSLYLLTEKLVYALAGNVKIAHPNAELNDDTHNLWAPITHPIPKEKPEYPIELQRDSRKYPGHSFLASVATAAERKYWWDWQAWEVAQKVCEKFQHHKHRHLFLEIDSGWRTPAVAPAPPRLAGPGLKAQYTTLLELVSACQFYLWDLQRWEEDQENKDTDIDTAPSQSQDPELPAMSNRKRESVVTADHFQRRKAPRRASQRRESYYANTWIPSDQLDPPSESATGAEQEENQAHTDDEEENKVDEDDEETIRLESPAGQARRWPSSDQPHDATFLDELVNEVLLRDEQLPTSPPSELVPSSTQQSSQADFQHPNPVSTDDQAPAGPTTDTLATLLETVKDLRCVHARDRLRDLNRERSSTEKEARRHKEDCELRIAHMKKYAYSVAEIEWEEAKMARYQARYREDIEGSVDLIAIEENELSKDHEVDA